LPFLGEPQEVAKKRVKTFPLGTPLALPRYKAKQEIDVSNFHAVLQGRHHARQAKNSKSRYGAKK